jgi:hypothetical protein
MRLALLGVAVLPIAVGAQDTTAKRPARFCLGAYDSTRCEAHVISEVAASRAMTSSVSRRVYSGGVSPKRDFEWAFHGALGAARNFSGRKSLGAAAVFDAQHTVGLSGVELRYRDWLDTTNVALELQLGYSRPEFEIIRNDQLERQRFGGLRAGAALTVGPYVTVFTRGELVNFGGQRHGALFAGIGGTSHASYGTVGVLGLLAIIAIPFIVPDT